MKIKERWRSYFHKLLNECHIDDLRCLRNSIVDENIKYAHIIRISKIKDATEKKRRKGNGTWWYSYSYENLKV